MRLPRRRRSSLVVVCLALAAAQAHALAYLSPADLDLTVLLAPPPPAGSMTQAADLAAVLAAQQSRSVAEAKSAVEDARVSVFRFADVLGPAFNEKGLPLTTAFFAQMQREVVALGRHAKSTGAGHGRHDEQPDQALVQTSSDDHIPAGTHVRLRPRLAGPHGAEQRQALIDWVRYGDNRVTAGVHHLNDAAAGRVAATAMAAVLLQKPGSVPT
jgi:acid phosphatase (class A)